MTVNINAAFSNMLIEIESKVEYMALGCLLAAQMSVEVLFWPLHPAIGNGINYCYGALISYVAQPPGSIGYCLLGRLFNYFLHNIQGTFVTLSIVASMLATALVYWAGKAFGLTGQWAWLAAAMYGFSINTLVSSLFIAPYALEGTFAALFALLALRANRNMEPACAVVATLTFAVAGLFRPTTTYLLAPLWLYWLTKWMMSWKRKKKLPLCAAHIILALGVIVAWQAANRHFMSKAGYASTYEMQALMPSSYEYATFSFSQKLGPVHLTYHMPLIELISWIEKHVGIRLLPQIRGTPTPSIRRAAMLTIIQAVKQAWWLFLSAPVIIVVPLLWLSFRRPCHRFSNEPQRLFLLVWVAGPLCFFCVGHLGYLGYLQIYLAAICIASSDLLMRSRRSHLDAFAIGKPMKAQSVSPATWAIGAVIASLMFFLMARPTGAPIGLKRGLDLVALNYGGYSIKLGLSSARSMGNTGKSLSTNPISAARTDEQLLEAMRVTKFSPAPVFDSSVSR